MNYKWIIILFLLLPLTAAFALDTDTELAKVSQTPFARNPETKYYSLPFVNYFNFDYGAYQRTQYLLELKPIISFQLSPSYDLIMRLIAPVFNHQPSSTASQSYINGWGDINPTAFISPARYRTNLWGVGPSIVIPTASNAALGSGKWSLGPEFAFFSMPEPWVIGILTSNIWSVAGDPSRKPVDQFSLQYFISYNFHKGWFLTSQPTITANWKAVSNQMWTVPFGFGGGKGFTLPNGGITCSLQSYYNVIRPNQIGPNWTIEAKIEFDFADRQVIPL